MANYDVAKTTQPHKQRPSLRSYRHAFLLLVLYVPLVLNPWTITLTLAHRPLTKTSYAFAPGFTYKEYKLMQGWARAIPILNAVAAILAIPVTSSLCAQAAVVFAQRRNSRLQLSVRQLLGLADRVWGDWGRLKGVWSWSEPGSARVKRFVFAAAGLVVLGAVQYPLFQLLAPWKTITIPTCADTRYIKLYNYEIGYCDFRDSAPTGYTQIGIDLEPAQMAVIPASYVLPRIRSELSTVPSRKLQPHLWPHVSRYGYRPPADIDHIDGFVAGLPVDTTTGVLREHIMRLNSSVSCTNVTASEYPSLCPGATPFQASFEYTASYYLVYNATVDICAPGDQDKHPWTVSRSRQELSEEVFLRFSGTPDTDGVLRCTAQTTRGYFELGNVRSGGLYGPLLERWPSKGPPLDDFQFNDYFGSEVGAGNYAPGYIPSEEDHSLGGAKRYPDRGGSLDSPATFTDMSGPLMMSVLALFGNDSWVHSVRNLTLGSDEDTLLTQNTNSRALLQPLCELTPFRRAGASADNKYMQDSCTRDLSDLHYGLSNFLASWNDNPTAAYRLSVAVFLANQAALTSHSEGILPWMSDTGREIYTAPGLTVHKPVVSLPAQVVLSVIVGVQVVGLLWMGWFIYTWPTWTRTLDSMAVARVAGQLDRGLLPLFAHIGAREQEELACVDGLVGVQVRRRVGEPGTAAGSDVKLVQYHDGGSTSGKGAASSTISVTPADSEAVVLGLGAPGLVTKRGARETPVSDRGV